MSNIAYLPVEYWDARAKDYAPGELGVLGENLISWYARHRKAGLSILEVGSGEGRLYRLFAREYFGIRSYRMCEIAHEMAQKCYDNTGEKPDRWDGVTLPYFDYTFDWVISANVLLHVPPADLDQHVSELARVSRRYVFVSTYIGPGEGLASHCFSHDYEMAWQCAGLDVEAYAHFEKEQQGQWLLTV